MKPLLAISMGDYNGIGPEIALKSVLHPVVRKVCAPLLVGSIDVFAYYAERLRLQINLKEVGDPSCALKGNAIAVFQPQKFHTPVIRPGTLSRDAGKLAGEAIHAAAGLCSDQFVDGMVTAPIAKETLNMAGYHFPGHTEMLARLTGAPGILMMLVAAQLRVGLVTIHLPLRKVVANISGERIVQTVSLMNESLMRDFRIRRPRIAVLSINPHAGEGGILGTEESTIISPAIRSLRRKKVRAEGPFPADGFFGARTDKRYDGVVAMYHDQGLIPLKLLGFSFGVNYSAGLPIVRTSPDHGTAFSIAGRGIADPSSMIEAIKLAAAIIRNRQRR